jgi:hypothetical protein
LLSKLLEKDVRREHSQLLQVGPRRNNTIALLSHDAVMFAMLMRQGGGTQQIEAWWLSQCHPSKLPIYLQVVI